MSMNIFFLQHVISTLILWKKNETLLHKATSGDESASLHRMAPPDTPDHGCIARTPMGNCLTDPPCTIALDLVYPPSTSRRWAVAPSTVAGADNQPSQSHRSVGCARDANIRVGRTPMRCPLPFFLLGSDGFGDPAVAVFLGWTAAAVGLGAWPPCGGGGVSSLTSAMALHAKPLIRSSPVRLGRPPRIVQGTPPLHARPTEPGEPGQQAQRPSAAALSQPSPDQAIQARSSVWAKPLAGPLSAPKQAEKAFCCRAQQGPARTRPAGQKAD
jgi:hypothetical protein